MTTIMAGTLGGEVPPIRIDRLSVLSLAVNAVCNLSCEHCYLRPEGPPIGIQSQSWLKFLRSVFADLRPHSVAFTGKEVFALDESASLFFDSIRLRNLLQDDIGDRTRIGVITNATLLERYRSSLHDCLPDWLDVSIDGLQMTHDQVRGKGAFAKMAKNLPWMIDSLGDRLWIALTLTEGNMQSLPEIISGLNRTFGLRRFSIGIYKPQSYTNTSLSIASCNRESRILRSLLALAEIDLFSNVEVKFDFDSGDCALRRRVENEGLIPMAGVLRIAMKQFDNGLTLRFSTTAVPVGLWRAIRVTNEGHIIAAEDLVDASRYHQQAIANIADLGYDARRMYDAGLSHPRFRDLMGATADDFFRSLGLLGKAI